MTTQTKDNVTSGSHWFDAVRYVADRHQYVYLRATDGAWSTHKRKGFTILDAVTANALLSIDVELAKLDSEQKGGKSNRQETFRAWTFAKAYQLLGKVWGMR